MEREQNHIDYNDVIYVYITLGPVLLIDCFTCYEIVI